MSLLVSIFKPLAYVSLPIIILRSLATTQRPTLRYWVHLGTYIASLGVVATWAVFIAAGFSLVGKKYDVNWMVARTFYWVTTSVLDLTVELEGEEHLSTRPAVLMTNHQSMLDVFMLGSVFPKRTSMMAKKQIQWGPLGPFMTMSGAVFIDRGNNTKAIRSIEAAGESMKANNTSLWMYPEGTRHMSEVPEMLPFKKGGFHLAIQAGIPIVPIVAENYWRIYHKGVFGAGVLRVKVLPPIPTAHLTSADASELAERVHASMLETLREISVKVPVLAAKEKTTASARDETPIPIAPVEITPSLDIETPASSSESSTGSSVGGGHRVGESEAGTETEEDEGMVIVGRPS